MMRKLLILATMAAVLAGMIGILTMLGCDDGGGLGTAPAVDAGSDAGVAIDTTPIVCAGKCGDLYHFDVEFNLYCVPDEPVANGLAGTPCVAGCDPTPPPAGALVGFGYVICKPHQ